MIMLNPQKLAILLQSQSPVSDDVIDNSNILANRLIRNLQIQSGHGLSAFLGVDSHFDNFTAVRYWVHQQYAKIDTGDEAENYAIVKDKFLDCMPEMA